MNTLLEALSRDPCQAPVQPLSLAVVYEDLETHNHATAAYESLVRALIGEEPPTATWWRTSLIVDPKLARIAARAIAASRLILIAVRGDMPPITPLRDWIESWPLLDADKPQLLAFLEGRLSGDGPWDIFLRRLADRRQMIYVPGEAFGSEWIRPRAHGRTPDRYSRCIEPYSHGGLNE